MENNDRIKDSESLDKLLELILNEIRVPDLNANISKSDILKLIGSARHTKDQHLKSFIDTLRKKYFCNYCLSETPILLLKCGHQYCSLCSLELIANISITSVSKMPKKISCLNNCTKNFSVSSLKPLLTDPSVINSPEYAKIFFLANSHIKPPPNLFESPNPTISCSLCGESFPVSQIFYPCFEDPYCKDCLLTPLSKMTCSICYSPISIQKISELLNK